MLFLLYYALILSSILLIITNSLRSNFFIYPVTFLASLKCQSHIVTTNVKFSHRSVYHTAPWLSSCSLFLHSSHNLLSSVSNSSICICSHSLHFPRGEFYLCKTSDPDQSYLLPSHFWHLKENNFSDWLPFLFFGLTSLDNPSDSMQNSWVSWCPVVRFIGSSLDIVKCTIAIVRLI